MMYHKMRYSAVVSCLLLLSSSSVNVTGSAIPMWEFLSRGEKVSAFTANCTICCVSLVQESQC